MFQLLWKTRHFLLMTGSINNTWEKRRTLWLLPFLLQRVYFNCISKTEWTKITSGLSKESEIRNLHISQVFHKKFNYSSNDLFFAYNAEANTNDQLALPYHSLLRQMTIWSHRFLKLYLCYFQGEYDINIHFCYQKVKGPATRQK